MASSIKSRRRPLTNFSMFVVLATIAYYYPELAVSSSAVATPSSVLTRPTDVMTARLSGPEWQG